VRVLAVALAALAITSACAGADSGSEVRSNAPRAAVDASAARSGGASLLQLTAALLSVAPADRNVVVSPWIVGEDLAILHAGASGTSAEAIESALDLPTDEIGPASSAVRAVLAGRAGRRSDDRRSGDVTIRPANDLWLQRGTVVEPSFLDSLARWYDTGVRVADIRSDPDQAREAVNTRLAEQTDGVVEGLATPGDLTSDTRLLLAGALWFRAPWDQEFDAASTEPGPFTRSDGSTRSVEMMTMTDPAVGYASGDGWKAVELPYLGRELSMVVIVPEPGHLDIVGAALDGELLTEVLADLAATPVTVRLPRFSFTSREPLDDDLAAMGLGVLGDLDAADLSRITRDERLVVSQVLHQSSVSVDEEGSGSSAATVRDERTPVGSSTTKVDADRPFLFLVVDRSTSAPLLAGRVVDPAG
jgi:serpin B